MTIADGEIEKWTTWMLAAGRPPTTIGLRTYHVRRTFHEVGESPYTVTTEQLVEWLAVQPWMPATRRSYRMSLRAFFLWAQATGRRVDNPADLMPVIKVPRGIPRPTPEAVYRTALRTATPELALMLELAAVCGLRRGEMARLRREDVQFDLVGPYLRVLGKGGHERAVPLPEELASRILAGPAGWVFPSPSPRCAGRHMTPAHLGRMVSMALPQGWTCHTLRHRCATVARANGHDLRTIQELLGHAKPETTALYTLVPLTDVRAAVASAAA